MPAHPSTVYFIAADEAAMVEEGYFATREAAEAQLRQVVSEVLKAYSASELEAVGAPIEAFKIAWGLPMHYAVQEVAAQPAFDSFAPGTAPTSWDDPGKYASGRPIWILTMSECQETEDGYEVDEEIAQNRAECLNRGKWDMWTLSAERTQGMSFKEYAEHTYGGAIRLQRLESRHSIEARRVWAQLAWPSEQEIF